MKKLILTEEQIKALEVLADASYDVKDSIRSVLHSASIKKGHKHPIIVSNELGKIQKFLKNELEVFIPFENIDLPENYSQSSGYTVDIYFETENEILLIDPKGGEHNNNTPISDEIKKWLLTKTQVQKNNPKKNVRFILLKPNDVTKYNFNRLKKKYSNYGIELYISDDFLSNMKNQKIVVSDILKEIKSNLMSDGLRSLL
jgi:hypothetical protein